jgi:hypothetical protein
VTETSSEQNLEVRSEANDEIFTQTRAGEYRLDWMSARVWCGVVWFDGVARLKSTDVIGFIFVSSARAVEDDPV